jgi:hypothetical protein
MSLERAANALLKAGNQPLSRDPYNKVHPLEMNQ